MVGGPVTQGCLGQLGEQDDLNSCNLFFLLGLAQETADELFIVRGCVILRKFFDDILCKTPL